MDQLFVLLKNVISSEIMAYKKLLVFSKQKKEILVKNKTADLSNIVSQEQGVLSTIKQLEQERENYIIGIAKAHGEDWQQVDFQKVIDWTDGGIRQELMNLREELKAAISELSSINTLNKTLLGMHMQYISFCMEAVAGQLNGMGTYSKDGHGSNQKNAGNVILNQTI